MSVVELRSSHLAEAFKSTTLGGRRGFAEFAAKEELPVLLVAARIDIPRGAEPLVGGAPARRRSSSAADN